MTREEIIAEIWHLSIWDVFRVAMADDLILFVKLYPLWLLLGLVIIVIYAYDKFK